MNRLCLVFFVVVVVCVTSIVYGEIIKCCESNYRFKKINGILKCSYNPSNKLQIFTNATNFLQNNTEGQCVEFFENFYIFNVRKSVISPFKIIDEKKIYSKCCPLNFLYNTLTHGCEKIAQTNHSEIKQNFIKVGLPTCKVIVDKIVENITEEFNNNNSSCVDRTKNGSFILRKCLESKDVCKKMRCVRKCCPDGQTFLNNRRNGTCIEGHQGINLTELAIRGVLEFPEDPFVTVVTNKYTARYFINESNSPVYFNRKGTFSYIGLKSHENLTSSNYCLEYIKTQNTYSFWYEYFKYNKNTSKNTNTMTKYFYYFLPISAILLGITIAVYFLLNKVKKMLGKIFVNYCLIMLVWYAELAYLYLGKPKDGCLRRAFSIMFERIAIFSWSNVLCWHICRTFGSMSCENEIFRKKNNYKKMILYSLYGWGIPAVLSTIIFSFHIYKNKLPYVIRPIIGNQCYMDSAAGNYSRLLLLELPSVLLQFISLVLIIKTMTYCLKVKNEIKINECTHKLEQFGRNKAKLFLVLKLMIIMAVAFISKITTSFVPMSGPVDEFLFAINSSQGIFVFIVSICNRQMYNNIKKKLEIWNTG